MWELRASYLSEYVTRLAEPDMSYALVICSDKLSFLLNYSDLDCLSTFMMADGAAAAVLKKGESTNQIVYYHAITNGTMADYMKVPLAGIKFPLYSQDINT